MEWFASLSNPVRIAILFYSVKEEPLFSRRDEDSRIRDTILLANIEKAHSLLYVFQTLCDQITALGPREFKIGTMLVSNGMSASFAVFSKGV